MIAKVGHASRRDRKRVKKYHAFLNGEDISRRCFYADTARGVVRVFWSGDGASTATHGAMAHMDAPPAHGRRLYNGFLGALTEELHGKVRIEMVQQ